MTASTKHLLLEVTGPSSLEVCKKVMDELLYAITQLGVGTDNVEVPKRLSKPTAEEVASSDATIGGQASAGLDGVVEGVSKVSTEDAVDDKETAMKEGVLEECVQDDVVDAAEASGYADKVLVVAQVKVIDEFNKLKVLYPSRTDLSKQEFNVLRNFD